MAGRRIDGSSSMVALFENKGICTNGIEALLAPGSFADGFPGPQFMMNSDCTYNNSLKYDLEETADDDLDDHLQQPGKKRRLTANQVQFLEKNFELENKLEPERKFQLAKGLGLNPRQVSIWFQNRRARWKTKQLEKEYEYLKSSFVSLKVDHDNLLKENEKLQAEVVFLTSKLLHKENDNGSLESFELGKYPNDLQNIDSPTITRLKRLDAQVMLCKQEDLSSANSSPVVLDLEDDGGYSKLMDQPTSPMNAFETNQSDLSSHIDEVLGCGFVRPENHSCNYAFQEEDHALWFWP